MSNKTLELIEAGKISGFYSSPVMCETVISRVYIFEQEKVVLKIYKRDNNWWNRDMEDLSGGVSRINFISQDFHFNNFLNPKIYYALKAAQIRDGNVQLVEPNPDNDELIIVMERTDLSNTLTDALFKSKLTSDEYAHIGRSFAEIKLSIPKSCIPKINSDWHKQIINRTSGLESWVMSVKEFPKDIAERGLAVYKKLLRDNDGKIQKVTSDKMVALIDCNSENLLYFNRTLRIMDAYPPKLEWRRGTLDVDIFRVGSDIRALAGENAYQAYLSGVKEVLGDHLDGELRDFHLLYAALISASYYLMLAKNDATYETVVNKYLKYLHDLIS